MSAVRPLPSGYRADHLGDIDSTNSEALRRAVSGVRGPFWLTCERQTVGRGRGGRGWTSEPGNLYASLLLEVDVPLATVLQLPFVAAVAVREAIASIAGDQLVGRLQLKWPNDVLLDGAKVCGILVESQATPGNDGFHVAMGFGVNITHHPADTHRPACNLSDAGIVTTVETLFGELAHAVHRNLMIWGVGDGFTEILANWERCAAARGTEMVVQLGAETVAGTFGGLDGDGALLLNVADTTRRILYGDVMYPQDRKDRVGAADATAVSQPAKQAR